MGLPHHHTYAIIFFGYICIMIQVLLHLLGDYITQNEWMANNKSKSGWNGILACLVHVVLYSVPFLFVGSIWSFVVILVTHYLVDRYRLAIILIRLKNWNFVGNNFGFNVQTPIWLSTWLFIIIDNIIHLWCNYLALLYL